MGIRLSAEQVRSYILHARRLGILRVVRHLIGKGVYRVCVAEVVEGYRRQVLA